MSASAFALTTVPARADNPIVQHLYTADPAPMVHGDTVYLCTSHDEDVTVDNFFTMNDWRVFSSKDMVNWTDHGSPLSYRTFSWATGKAWAPHCVERDGKFYFYVPVSDAIGVAVADSPTGPFVDAIGRPLLSNYQYIDPSVFVDAGGQAYLYFGNPKLWYVKLNEDMISYSGAVEQVSMTAMSFGQRNGDDERPTLYEEGPWFYERNGLYHLLFAMGPLPEKIGYATSTTPTGPWSYEGVVMDSVSGHAFTNHAGVIDFKGRSYFFYHTQELAGGGGFKRSVAVEEFAYEADGSFPTIPKTKQGVTDSVAPLNPYARVEGETIAWGSGVEVEDCSEGGRAVTSIENDDSIKLRSVDFLTGPAGLSARVASGSEGGRLEFRLSSTSGDLVGSCEVPSTGGWQNWQTVECDVNPVTGTHDLYLVSKGGGGPLFNLNYWQFTAKDPLPTGTGGASGSGGTEGSGAAGSAGTPSGGASAGGRSATFGGSGGATASGGRAPNAGSSTGGATPADAGNTSGGAPSSTSGGALSGGAPSRGGSSGSQAFGGFGAAPSIVGGSATGSAPPPPNTRASDGSDSGCAVGLRSHAPSFALGVFGAAMAAAAARARRRRQRRCSM